jgi:hypothetical protein
MSDPRYALGNLPEKMIDMAHSLIECMDGNVRSARVVWAEAFEKAIDQFEEEQKGNRP